MFDNEHFQIMQTNWCLAMNQTRRMFWEGVSQDFSGTEACLSGKLPLNICETKRIRLCKHFLNGLSAQCCVQRWGAEASLWSSRVHRFAARQFSSQWMVPPEESNNGAKVENLHVHTMHMIHTFAVAEKYLFPSASLMKSYKRSPTFEFYVDGITVTNVRINITNLICFCQ